jgi:hypothetical protein
MIPERAHMVVHVSLKRTFFKRNAFIGLQKFSLGEPAVCKFFLQVNLLVLQ